MTTAEYILCCLGTFQLAVERNWLVLEAVAASGIKVHQARAKAVGSSCRPSFLNILEPHYSHPSHPVIHLL